MHTNGPRRPHTAQGLSDIRSKHMKRNYLIQPRIEGFSISRQRNSVASSIEGPKSVASSEAFRGLRANASADNWQKGLHGSASLITAVAPEMLTRSAQKAVARKPSPIQPVKKLDTFNIHAILYRIKKDRELLDRKIGNLEQSQKDFRENEICLIANSGAVDFILNLNAKTNPDSISNLYLQTEKQDQFNQRESKRRMTSSARASMVQASTTELAGWPIPGKDVNPGVPKRATRKSSSGPKFMQLNLGTDMINVENAGILTDRRSADEADRFVEQLDTDHVKNSRPKTSTMDFRQLSKKKRSLSVWKSTEDRGVTLGQSGDDTPNLGVAGKRANIFRLYVKYSDVEIKRSQRRSRPQTGDPRFKDLEVMEKQLLKSSQIDYYASTQSLPSGLEGSSLRTSLR